jgi:hypothetical protein
MKQIIVFNPVAHNRGEPSNIDINDQLPGQWTRFEGEISKPSDGDIYIQRIDEPFEYITNRGSMHYEAGDYIAITGSMEKGFVVWPVAADELSSSDGRVAAANRYISGDFS